ncbi:terpenoid synthase [Fistulina hepatica ATCC 64428]|uniref:(2E,6E)-farnesyl diphosphate synthase n=1 Tax=Fistulina hepatica ATCC 64428 TaxID=1128425 RepID=A0A0D7AG21_9AGAR|nr:terpenoid synthase [Fistulina hepatica ATCC 64428]
MGRTEPESSICFSRASRIVSSVHEARRRVLKLPDPLKFLEPHMLYFRERHPGLTEIARYYFLRPSKQLRPLLVFLFSQATNGIGRNWGLKKWESECVGAGGSADELDRPFTPPDVLNDWNPCRPDTTACFNPDFISSERRPRQSPPEPPDLFGQPAGLVSPPLILPTQMRLAQILEMIHAASLLHDDVIDRSPLRRGVASAPEAFGNKLSVLAGNFILGRASTALARLGDLEVIELIASIISNLVEGEILQMRDVQIQQDAGVAAAQSGKEAWTLYLQKTYMKTASLMAKGARAAVALGGCTEGELWREVAYAYGRNLGIAFQLIDDVLDYAAGDATLGKPGGADLQLGLATGPALYAWEEFPELGPLIARKFAEKGDVEHARSLVKASRGVERTRELAVAYAQQALEVIQPLPESEAKNALEALALRVTKRTF